MKHPLTALASLAAVLAAGPATPQDKAKAAPSVMEVMMTMTVPASDAIFSAASDPPKDDAQWVALRPNARTLADSGRALATMDRAKDTREWTEMARALVTQAEATLTAIDRKDADALSVAGEDVYLTCKTCHDRFKTD
jgi:cytochrome c556